MGTFESQYMTTAYARTSSSGWCACCCSSCGAIESAAPPTISSADASWPVEKVVPRKSALAAIVAGISDWLSSVWYCPGTYTEPIAVQKVPKQSSTPMMKKRR